MVSTRQLGYGVNVIVRKGFYAAIMQALVQQGFTVKTTADFMDDRIAPGVPARAMNWRWKTYFDTSDGIAGTKYEVIFDLNSLLLRAVTQQTQLTKGGIMLPEGYNAERVARSELGPLNRELTEKEARKSRGWFIFAGKDQKQLNAYVTEVFRRVKDEYGEDTAMALSVPDDGIVRAVVLSGLGYGSYACGERGLLGDGNAYLVGVHVGAETSEPVGSGITTYKSADILRVEKLLDPEQPCEGLEERAAEALCILREGRQQV